jgi:hypothetical protein
MTKKDFDKLIWEELLPKCREIMETKGMAYSGQEDKLGNFKRCAKLAGVTVYQAWFTYFVKHFDALSAFVRGEYDDCEPIEGRVVDLCNYLFLFVAILFEEKIP